jgi:hypothetical protein
MKRAADGLTTLPNWIFEKQLSEPEWLSCQELSILMAIQYFANRAAIGKETSPSHKSIAACAGVSCSTVIRCIRNLQHKGLLLKNERHRISDNAQISNSYLLSWQGKSLKNKPSNGKL